MNVEHAEASIWTDGDGVSHLQLWLDHEKVREKTLGEFGFRPQSRRSVGRSEAHREA